MPPGACQQHESLDITAGMQEPDAELDNFRREWHQEVSARRGGKTTVRAGPRPTALISGPGRPPLARVNAPPPATVGIDTGHFEDRIDDYTPRTFHDLEDKEEHLKLEHEATRGRVFTKEPRSALEHYEQAVEKEEQGSLGDSVALYRKAFKVCQGRIPQRRSRSAVDHFLSLTSTSKNCTRKSTFHNLQSLSKPTMPSRRQQGRQSQLHSSNSSTPSPIAPFPQCHRRTIKTCSLSMALAPLEICRMRSYLRFSDVSLHRTSRHTRD